jgi:hypothetical protein
VVTVCGVALSCAGEAVRFDGAVEESAKESVVPLTPETTVVIEGCPEPVTVATLEVCARSPPEASSLPSATLFLCGLGFHCTLGAVAAW